MSALYFLHTTCAVLSITGFFVRGLWLLRGSPLSQHRVTKTLPHLIDTLLLGSALGMLFIWRLNPFSANWLVAKIVALLLYIGLGLVALRFGKTPRQRFIAWLLALMCAAYIVSVAFTKDPRGLVALLS